MLDGAVGEALDGKRPILLQIPINNFLSLIVFSSVSVAHTFALKGPIPTSAPTYNASKLDDFVVSLSPI